MNAQLEELQQPDRIEVSVLAWPGSEDQRLELARARLPRLLEIDADGVPPTLWDELEDWYRRDAPVADVLARRETVQRRAAIRACEPVLDGNILRVGSQWVAIPPTRVPVVALLLERRGAVVRPAELAGAVTASGGSSDAAAVRAVLHRLSKSFASVGLRLHSVRGRGTLLELPSR